VVERIDAVARPLGEVREAEWLLRRVFGEKLMKFRSYSQNFEDVLLWRALQTVPNGFYIDVGAADPWAESVTAGFYEEGWRGVNVEPQTEYFAHLVRARPRDVNLQFLVGAVPGTQIFYEVSKSLSSRPVLTGLSTNVKSIADRHRESGFIVSESPAKVVTLAEISDRYAANTIHFLKIDVEGGESEVLKGMNFNRHRPWIVLVEATKPNTRISSHEQWEDILIQAAYRFVWFDGLNRFYVSAEQFEALEGHFKLPPNVFDDYVRGVSPAFPIGPVLEPDPFIEDASIAMSTQARTAMTTSCRDADAIPKVAGAGSIVEEPDGLRVQLMHNGLKVVADGYCGKWMTELIELCQGHHEPQEERVFHEVVKRVGANSTMIELGGNWSYYSMWFLQGAPDRRAIVVEPDPANRAVGETNVRLNGLSAKFVAAFAGAASAGPTNFTTERSGIVSAPRITVEELMRSNGVDELDILHCDAQGVELDVLQSCAELFRQRRIGWVFVSTHSHAITGDPLTHQRCLSLLRGSGATIAAEHDVHESFSGDGLIVARFGPLPPDWHPISFSHNRYSFSYFRNPIYDLAAEMRRRRGLPREEVASIVDAAYRAVLMRSADATGLLAYTNALVQQKMGVQQLIERMFKSKEFKSKQTSFQSRYFESPASSSIPANQIRYLRRGGALECTGFRFKLKSDCALGCAGDTIVAPIDNVILPALFDEARWQLEHVKRAAQVLDASRKYALIDIGANIGLFSRQFLNAFPNISPCICVEPDADNFAALEYNLRKFDHRDIRLFNVALDAVDGAATLYRDDENIGNYSLNANAVQGCQFDERQVRTADARTWAAENILNIGELVVKIDTQGWDEAIVARMPSELWSKVVFACIEIWRIDKPGFDAKRLRRVIEAFPNRSFSGAVNCDIDQIIDYAAGTDRRFQDLLLWR
jgi:FkbM family methyltransferase